MRQLNYGQVRNAIVDYLLEHPSSTANDIAEAISVKRGSVQQRMKVLRKLMPEHPWHVFVSDWRQAPGRGANLAHVYRLGPGIDRPKPQRDYKAARLAAYRRYEEKHRFVRNLRRRVKTNPWMVAAGNGGYPVRLRAAQADL